MAARVEDVAAGFWVVAVPDLLATGRHKCRPVRALVVVSWERDSRMVYVDGVEEWW